ncbi:MAG: hypothetical protein HYS26_04750 [Candidatus Kaiserbacteria bacterium]|nr:MAG: hypothetical protein HYS26_04750 [Candidatus Kaiserbacteria bacterium]
MNPETTDAEKSTSQPTYRQEVREAMVRHGPLYRGFFLPLLFFGPVAEEKPSRNRT